MKLEPLHTRAQEALAKFAQSGPLAPPWEGSKIVIYGAGGFGRDLAGALLGRGERVVGFLDQSGTGEPVVHGLKSYKATSDQAKKWVAEKVVALIGTHNGNTSLREVSKLLEGFGFARSVTPMEMFPYLASEMGSRYWLGIPADYAKDEAQIKQAAGVWADEASERLYLETLLFRTGFDINAVAIPSNPADQYAEPTIPRWKEPLAMVDGGAFTGDTISSLLQHGYTFSGIHAFEPDLGNFESLKRSVLSLRDETSVCLWPCGISSSTKRLRFSDGKGLSSKISDSGSSVIPVVALDDILHGQRINLIKFDIEGSEPDALQGAVGLIEKNRPGLAICLYHLPHHLWSIPLWIKGLGLGYRLYCRMHAYNTYETVLYAVAE